MSYILTFPNIGTEDLLKEEVRLFFPTWRLSFSKPGFISYKTEEEIDFPKLKKLTLIFSRRLALFKEKLSGLNASQNFDIYSVSEGKLVKKNHSSERDSITERDFLVEVGKEFWLAGTIGKIDGLDLNIELPEASPSRAYLKIAEMHKLFSLDMAKSQIFLELGSAPGGMSYYVCQLGAYLTAVDPGEMDPLFVKNYPLQFKHVKKSVFDLKLYDLPDIIDWMMVDLNLEGKLSLKESLKLAKEFRGPKFKGLLINLKTPNVEDLVFLKDYEEIIRLNGFKNFRFFQLPSHRREFAAWVLG